ncbi:MAG TPA: 23S rRNA (pseudouridine(1915)-N(3))-methyltransferase RlmH [Gammaproteobacteria bacterium]|nr:23S rRNA (pseudouridine(1915)-N(3))-methyltransferase RlmH [Gammaproteobacteria bacterium]
MNLRVLTIGNRMPGWVDEGFRTYATRLPHECALSLTEIPLPKRTPRRAGASALEGKRMLGHIRPDDEAIALDVRGKSLTTEALAQQFGDWLQDGRDRVFLIGGPDGLAPDALERADWRWSLSPLTLPHGLARVVVAEALYRAWTVLQGHPYHRV